jgi:hypothetical protein
MLQSSILAVEMAETANSYKIKDSKLFGVDLARPENFLGTNFHSSNAVERIPEGDIIYCRFFVHALTEAELDTFLETIKKQASIKSIFIETRSTKGISMQEKCETYFKSGIGTEHFRMLYSMPYLYSKISQHFDVSYLEESNQFSPFRGEEPHIIRLICHA